MKTSKQLRLEVSLTQQQMHVLEEDKVVRSYAVSTALNGAGEVNNSGCTPRGLHVIDEKIGDGQPINAVFVGRVATGEVYTEQLAQTHPDRDWILTRILWLSGLEPGFNSGGNCDSKQRYIYIHGTPDSEPMGKPYSHGCIRMRNTDVLELYDLVSVGCEVHINE